MIDAIVPAHNEEPTVAAVAGALVDSGVFRRVIVVDDGSSDATAQVARQAGAEVLRLIPNRGKAQAMLAAVAQSDAEAFGFFDADLYGLDPKHAQLLVAHYALGFDMVCGLRDYGWLNPVQVGSMPLMTGERIVARWVLEELPRSCWKGYAIETAMNFIVDRAGGSTCLVPMKGVTIRNKVSKVGWLQGMAGHAKMLWQMYDAHTHLHDTGLCEL